MTPKTSDMRCPVCAATMALEFSEKVLHKYQVSYYLCESCGFLRTEKPYWLEESYTSAIAAADTGIVVRNLMNADFLEATIRLLNQCDKQYVDTAGGYGLLTRLLRDRGFDFYSTDKFCQNLFAGSWEPTDDMTPALVCAFEVMEHVEDPCAFIQEIQNTYNCDSIIFSTKTFSPRPPDRGWWYYAFETGQHISFYQPRTIAYIAKKFGFTYYPIDENLHIFTKKKISRVAYFIARNKWLRDAYRVAMRRIRPTGSKTWADHRSEKAKIQPTANAR